MTPATGFVRLLWSVIGGLGLGLGFDIVRPLRPRFIGDLIFLGYMSWMWIEFSFGICLGDLRFGYLFGAVFGFILWQLGPGRLTKPIFTRFWHIFAVPFKNFLKFFQKILKFLFSSRKKSSTIE